MPAAAALALGFRIAAHPLGPAFPSPPLPPPCRSVGRRATRTSCWCATAATAPATAAAWACASCPPTGAAGTARGERAGGRARPCQAGREHCLGQPKGALRQHLAIQLVSRQPWDPPSSIPCCSAPQEAQRLCGAGAALTDASEDLQPRHRQPGLHTGRCPCSCCCCCCCCCCLPLALPCQACVRLCRMDG